MANLWTAPLRTERLLLRGLVEADAADLVQLAGDRRIADTMVSVPHPYTLEHAVSWIQTCQLGVQRGQAIHFALLSHGDSRLRGVIEVRAIDPEHEQAELGFWVGCPWWGQGYATEAATKMLELAFVRLELNRIYAHHMLRNHASGVVLGRIGMRREGVLRQRVKKWGIYEDVALWAILRTDWLARIQPGQARQSAPCQGADGMTASAETPSAPTTR
jgi:[ribosomal protein S5]-alanine N-acetyltransferase